jgi:predicted GNAT superfamily acetyltransferase
MLLVVCCEPMRMQNAVEPILRDFHETDSAALLELNANNRPEVGPLDIERLRHFASVSPFFKVAHVRGTLVGFLLGTVDSSRAYAGPEFRWFRARHATFAYVVRVAIADSARGQGLGPRFYHAFENWAIAAGKPLLCADVNTIPANPRSLRFHTLFGFHEVGRTNPDLDGREVAMLAKTLLPIPKQARAPRPPKSR